jgi:pyruvate kinase
VAPIICEHTPVTDDMVRSAERLLWQRGVVHNGDVISIVAGTRTASGSTNFLRLHVVGSMDFSLDGTGDRRRTPRTPKAAVEKKRG